METFRLRKSSPSTSTDDRSASRRLREGKRKVQEQINFPKLASGSIAQNSDTIAENSVKCESGWRSSNRATGTPIKKSLAEEMFRETEPRKRSPGVIARLMGFDGLPPQQLSNNQPKRSEENFQPRMTSAERSQRSSTSCSHRSSRRSSKEDREFKDVFEVSDSSKMESSCYSLKGPARSKLTEAEMTYVKHKLLDVSRLSTAEKLNESEEFHDAIEDLHSNQDLLLKYLEEPDSLFTKHVRDLQAGPFPSNGTHISVLKLLSSRENEGKGLGGKIVKESLWKQRKKPNEPLSHSNNKHSAEISHFKSSKIQVEGKVESSVLPTRIVVLKPNCGLVRNATKSVSSPQSPHDFLSDCKKHTELYSIKDWEVELCGKKRFSNNAVHQRYKSRESREIAKEITRKMRNNLESGHTKLSTSGFKGYAGDESSSNRSDNESANESDVPSLVSRNSIHRSNRWIPSSSRSAESSVNKEARKRLSERWKMTHRSADMGTICRGSTLGEMLAMPDMEERPANADAMVGKKGYTDKFVGIDRPIGWVEPLGISSQDGWKDGCVGKFSRSSSIPASCATFGSPRTGMIRETLFNEKYLLPKEVTQQEKIMVKGNFNHRDASSSRNSRPRAKVSHFSVYSYTDYSDTSLEIQFSRKKVENRTVDEDRIENAVVTDLRVVPQHAVGVTIDHAVIPSKPNTDTESRAITLAQDTCSAFSQESSFEPPEKGSVLKHSAAGLEFPGSSKEAEQPSPVSVLETPFPDDRSSSSEWFESVSADIHGLWMQIQLLKSESESYEEGDMVISSVEVDETCEEKGRTEDSKEICYVKDVLTESGINVAERDSFIASLHASESPVNPLVFEKLEKHWGVGCWPRSERKLLFDRINSALVVMKQQFGDAHPWVKNGNGRVDRWIKNGVEENVHKLLEIQQKNVNEDAVVTDSQWLDMRADIDIIGREIEKLLMEELANEILVELLRCRI